MGYYTNYQLSVDPPLSREVPAELEDECYELYWALKDQLDDCKWYDHETDMRSYSKKYPTHTFRLEGNGEENGDWWVKYFRNGKMQRYEAELPPFDETGEWS